jgi:hypothetical protein
LFAGGEQQLGLTAMMLAAIRVGAVPDLDLYRRRDLNMPS